MQGRRGVCAAGVITRDDRRSRVWSSFGRLVSSRRRPTLHGPSVQLFAACLIRRDPVAKEPCQPPPSNARSNVERFRTPEMRAGRAETDAGAKLASDKRNDAQLRAAARCDSQVKEAYENLRAPPR